MNKLTHVVLKTLDQYMDHAHDPALLSLFSVLGFPGLDLTYFLMW